MPVTNRLISEKSPYLLQHAHNPVDWYPWGDEAFEKARKEDKPIFLSIGYSTCHWCHVMEKESFEDSETAKLLNETFVSIKVDREERPDLDSIYMKVCQILTGSGGWPLHIIMTPDKKPFFAATYIPKESKFGRAGMKELIPKIKAFWESRKGELFKRAQKITTFLQQAEKESVVPQVEGELGIYTLDATFEYLSKNFDERNGGFGIAPKFPSPHNLTFLLRYWNRNGNEKALWMVEKTLRSMWLGGIYDHIGFGFHRYSTDSRWLVPHFEKMLYDQAMLIIAYTEAYQATGKEEYKHAAREIITYVMRDMTAADGAFYSAEDADTEGEEGKFYLWTEKEIREVLPADDAEFAIKIFSVEKEGNFEDKSPERKTGRNILRLKRSINEIASKLKIPLDEIHERLDNIRQKLFAVRGRRVHPDKDDKILTDWNGLMIAALARAVQVFNEETYVNAAKKATDFIIENMLSSKGRLYHRYRDGEAAIPGFLDDYAFFVWGLIELYETTFEVKYLQLAILLTEDMIERFWDKEHGGFYFTASDVEEVLVRNKKIYDGAYPSGNSIAMLNLLRLARMTAKTEFENKAVQIPLSFSKMVSDSPSAYTQLLIALDFALGPSYEIVVVGKPHTQDTKNMLRALRKKFIPNKVVLFRPAEIEQPEITHFAEFTRDLSSREGRATAYVCRNYACNLPTTRIEKMLELLNANDR